jgi:RNA polymerase sigma factor FliA
VNDDEIYQWIKYIATRMGKNTPHEVGDLISVGYLGYAAAEKNFKPDNGSHFKTFAEHRIRGAILDYFREQTPGKRYFLSRKEQRVPVVVSYDEIMDSEHEDRVAYRQDLLDRACCFQEHLDIKQISQINEAVELLPKKEREIVRAYFWDERLQEEIAQDLGITNPYVSQIITKAKIRLKRILEGNQMPKHITPTEIARCVEAIESTRSLREAAVKLGIGYNTLYVRTQNHPELRKAYDNKGHKGCLPQTITKDSAQEKQADPFKLESKIALPPKERLVLPDFGFKGTVTIFRIPYEISLSIQRAEA